MPAGTSTTEPPQPSAAAKGRRSRTLLGPAVQVAVAGGYAWAVTVAPVAWSSGAPRFTKALALAALGCLAATLVVDLRAAGARTQDRAPSASRSSRLGWWRSSHSKIAYFWLFFITSGAVWVLAPRAVLATSFDGLRGLFGVVGWMLYALAWAGPSPSPDQAVGPVRTLGTPATEGMVRRSRIDDILLLLGLFLAVAIQSVGSGASSPERAVLVRIVTVAAGLAVFTTTSTLLVARHAPRYHRPVVRCLRRALPWLVLLALLAAAGELLSR